MSDTQSAIPLIAGLDTTPDFSCEGAEKIVSQYYGMSVRASDLPSERDQNFSLKSEGGDKFVLKIANASEDYDVLDFQSKAFEYGRDQRVPLELPELVATISGERIATVTDEAGRLFLMRLVTWVYGDLMVDVDSHDEKLMWSAGRQLAALDKALLQFDHPAKDRQLCWDVRYAKEALEHLPLLNEKQANIVEHLIAPALDLDWDRLELSVIHSDANDYNLLVREGRVTGLIDFGDMVYSALAAEPAIAAAYAMLDKANPLESASQLVSAYLHLLPLKAYDRAAILPLALARLCMSVCFAAHNASAKPDDPYQLVTSGPGWKTLEYLSAYSWEELNEIWGDLMGDMNAHSQTVNDLLEARKGLVGPNLSVSYNQPLNIVRGEGAYLFDETGRAFLDCVNNVSHVGHCHPRVVEAGAAQMRVLNTNTRYLNRLLTDYATRLTATLPDPLNVVFFTNSGSEANELALRLARTYTGRQDVAVLDVAYHGTTTSLIDMSPYKHDGKGGTGPAPWVHVAPMPDAYRGPHRGSDAGVAYGEEVRATLSKAKNGAAAFIAESALGCGGQIILPDGFLASAYEHASAAGAVCIADEVQTGMGRAGTDFWMFETQGVVPDIVTIGKPIGNGHPMAAVVTTQKIAEAFANGMEYFNTFGGNPVSCAIGLAVLDVIEEEGLQANALKTGNALKAAFEEMATRHDIIGDVRGQGLFLGIELVRDRETLEPAEKEATRVINEMRARGMLLSTDGPLHNIIKIKPPVIFPDREVGRVVEEIDDILTRL